MFIIYDRTYNQTDDIKEIPSVYIDTSNKNNIVMFMFLLQYENKNYITTESVDEATSSSPVFFTENSFQEESLINKFYPCCPEPYPALHYKSVLSLSPPPSSSFPFIFYISNISGSKYSVDSELEPMARKKTLHQSQPINQQKTNYISLFTLIL